MDVSVTNKAPTLIANATGAAYQWIDCDSSNKAISGEMNASFMAVSNVNYAVIITKDGCIDTSICEAVNNLSALENSFRNEIAIYPNPTKGILGIDLGADYPEAIVVVKTL